MISKTRFKKIGIIGGMGPEATADLYLKIIKLFQEKFNAKYDADFPEIYIINLPLPDVVEEQDKQSDVKSKMLIEAAKKLKQMGAEVITIPCNTASFYENEIKKSVDIELLSILEATADEIKRQDLKKVGLIATEMTINTKIYENYLFGVELIVPNKEQQQRRTEIIMRILSGEKNENDKDYLYKLIKDLQNKGAEKIVLGCTDLPLLIKDKEKTIDSTFELAKAIVKRSQI